MKCSLMSRSDATLLVEQSLARDGLVIAGMDEVGRGALAGPVCVGAVVVADLECQVPAGMTDSKLLSAKRRELLREQILAWATAWAVGEASASEIDTHGIIGALRLAGRRAIAQIEQTFGGVDLVLLDGSHDWLTEPRGVATADEVLDLWNTPSSAVNSSYRVSTRVKADLHCATVAAASILAKCYRDAHMRDLASQYPQFAWDSNKGYASVAHRDALTTHGPSEYHRRTWKLPARN